jgi:hypothetical protein
MAMLKFPSVTVNQIATELGLKATLIWRWQHELRP